MNIYVRRQFQLNLHILNFISDFNNNLRKKKDLLGFNALFYEFKKTIESKALLMAIKIQNCI